MVVLVEASQENDVDKCERIWALLSDLYAANTSLFELTQNRRRLHAAELIVAAWRTCQSKGTVGHSSAKPEFVSRLKSRLAECTTESTVASNAKNEHEGPEGRMEPNNPQGLPPDQDVDTLFDLDFQDIDWAFWNSID